MSVLDRAALEDSPLADLHSLASEIGIDGFRRLRKAELIDAILTRQGGEQAAAPSADADADAEADAEADADTDTEAEADTDTDTDAEAEERPRRGRRRGGRGRSRRDDDDDATEAAEPEPTDRVAEGVVELLGNGSGFLRVAPPDPSDDDVYISAAQVRRCELVTGDKVTGPVRPPRRSERYPSLIRIDTINDKAADEVAEGTHFDDLPAAFPTQRFALESDDPTLKAIEWLTPVGRGSRVVVSGPARSGKTEALRRLAAALAKQEGLELTVVLAGVRPEEIAEWKASGPVEPAGALSFSASHDAQSQAVERAVDTAKRIAARGADAVVLVDGLDGLHPHTARKVLACARDIVDGGSLTIIATASKPHGGETTLIALDVALASTNRFPALDLAASGTLRPELLVGEAGAEAIAQARAQALGLSA